MSSLPWFSLILAGLFECGWAVGLKYSEGFSKPIPTYLTFVAMGISIWLLATAMKSIPVGTAYAVWTGIGAVGVAVLGMFLFNESRDLMKLFCLFLVIAGIVGLKLLSTAQT